MDPSKLLKLAYSMPTKVEMKMVNLSRNNYSSNTNEANLSYSRIQKLKKVSENNVIKEPNEIKKICLLF